VQGRALTLLRRTGHQKRCTELKYNADGEDGAEYCRPCGLVHCALCRHRHRAHLLRDAKYAIECGDTAFSAPFRWLLLRAIAIGRRRETLKDTTLKQYLYDLDRRLDRILAVVPIGEPGRKLHKRMRANRAHLFVFMSNRAVPPTNNISERHLRPSVIFRKVTNGFRCEWGAQTYAAFRSVVSTAKANRASVLDTVRFVISAKRPGEALAGAG